MEQVGNWKAKMKKAAPQRTHGSGEGGHRGAPGNSKNVAPQKSQSRTPATGRRAADNGGTSQARPSQDTGSARIGSGALHLRPPRLSLVSPPPTHGRRVSTSSPENDEYLPQGQPHMDDEEFQPFMNYFNSEYTMSESTREWMDNLPAATRQRVEPIRRDVLRNYSRPNILPPQQPTPTPLPTESPSQRTQTDPVVHPHDPELVADDASEIPAGVQTGDGDHRMLIVPIGKNRYTVQFYYTGTI